MHYVELQRSIAEVEVNIAPLQHNAFNVCKSDLKFFEAAVVGTWTVASHTPSLDAAVDDGVTGRLARDHEWDGALAEAVDLARDTERYAADDVGRRRAGPPHLGVGLGRGLGAPGAGRSAGEGVADLAGRLVVGALVEPGQQRRPGRGQAAEPGQPREDVVGAHGRLAVPQHQLDRRRRHPRPRRRRRGTTRRRARRSCAARAWSSARR